MRIFFPMTLFVELIVYHNEHSRTIRNASVRNPTAMFHMYAGFTHELKRHVICRATTLPVAQGTGLVPRILSIPRESKREDRGLYPGNKLRSRVVEKMKKEMCCLESARFGFLILLISITFSNADNFDKRKNVLVMIGDDVGFQTQVYNNTVCRTPNLNAFAKRSVTFKNGFTSVSSCSPSRSAILTGKKIYSESDIWVRKRLQ